MISDFTKIHNKCKANILLAEGDKLKPNKRCNKYKRKPNINGKKKRTKSNEKDERNYFYNARDNPLIGDLQLSLN